MYITQYLHHYFWLLPWGFLRSLFAKLIKFIGCIMSKDIGKPHNNERHFRLKLEMLKLEMEYSGKDTTHK